VNSETPWHAGRLDASRGPRRLLFGQMYEDAEIEREAFHRSGRIFCIASAGDTSMLLSQEHEVVACDINPVQLAYAQRRAGGALRETGDADRAMGFLRSFTPLTGWHKKQLQEFLALSDGPEQLDFWRTHLDTLRFRAGFNIILSRPILRMMYSSQFLSALPPRFGAILRKRLEKGIARHSNASNPYIHALLLGTQISSPGAIGSDIEFVSGDAALVLESCKPGSFAGFTLSNILDGAAQTYRERLIRAVHRAATPDAAVILRSFAEPSVPALTNHAERDRSMLWGVVDIRSVNSL
jgi:S-adenosylmethionine:diacylglycerol 3-amino-3-carboxypropyl transferase